MPDTTNTPSANTPKSPCGCGDKDKQGAPCPCKKMNYWKCGVITAVVVAAVGYAAYRYGYLDTVIGWFKK